MKHLLLFLTLVLCLSCMTPAQTVKTVSDLPEDELNDFSTAEKSERRLTGKVVKVSDGDTITVLDADKQQLKIRFEGIDAPESKQDFGQKAKQNLSDLVYDKTVVVVTSKVDKYKRFVGKVMLDGKGINLEQIKAGFAWHYKKYSDEQTEADRLLYAAEETKARAAKLGLWADPAPIAPWDWRQGVNNDNLAGVPIGSIIGNSNSRVYHTPGCSTYTKVSKNNRVIFKTEEEAVKAGYRRAGNCSGAETSNVVPSPTPMVPGASSTAIPEKPTVDKDKKKSERTYIRGPRGGCYYINDSGKKTYVDKGFCS